MLVIRKEQMQVLSDGVFTYFVEQMMVHLRKFFPEHTRDMSADVMRETIHQGIDHAEKHGIIAGHDVCLFVQLIVLFGPDFDENPELPWAVETISNVPFPDATAKAKGLHEEAILYLQSNGKSVHQNLASAGNDAFRSFSDLPVRPSKPASPPHTIDLSRETDPSSPKLSGENSSKGL